VLLAYVDREGHARVPLSHVEDGYNLGKWVTKQRTTRARGNREREARLEELPRWTWDAYADLWEDAFDVLCVYVEREGNTRVQQDHVEGGFNLGTWVATQRLLRDRMDPERRARLDALPRWTWAARVDRWEEAFAVLCHYVDREGHGRVPRSHVEGGFRLGQWVSKQRDMRSRISPERQARLETTRQWTWDPFADSWERSYELLRRYVRREGDALVPDSHVEDGFYLGNGVGKQRKSRERLESQRRTRLEALHGWSWDTRADHWEDTFAVALRFTEREGHARVPHPHTENGVKLGHWISAQRKRRDRLDPERRARLESLAGWSWDPFADAWEQSYELLRQYARREGHARVPAKHLEGSDKLGSWVSYQRTSRDRLTREQQARLERLPGWTWNAR
jgi:hypothetical protein